MSAAKLFRKLALVSPGQAALTSCSFERDLQSRDGFRETDETDR